MAADVDVSWVLKDKMKKNAAKTYGGVLRFIKFSVVGVFNTVVDFIVYALMGMLGLHYLPAQVIGYAFGAGNSYLMNSLWTFFQERKHTAEEFGRFLLVNLVSLCVSLGVLWLSKNALHIQSDLLYKAIATPAAMVVNFTGYRLFVFKAVSNEQAAPEGQTPAAQAENAAKAQPVAQKPSEE